MTKILRRKTLLLLLLGAAALSIGGLALYCRHVNSTFVIRRYTLPCPSLPEAFDGMVIVQVSDLHGNIFGSEQDTLLEAIAAQQPDLIALTGDMIDGRRKQIEGVRDLYRSLSDIAPCYSVTGNHEWYLEPSERQALLELTAESGITMLDDGAVAITRDGRTLTLAGLSDPSYLLKDLNLGNAEWTRRMEALYAQALDGLNLPGGRPEMGVLLCHNPLAAQTAADKGWDVVLSGHLHGGVVGLPGDRGLVCPNGGIFCRTAGIQQVGGCWSVISRGMGNSVIPIRIADPMELVVVTLKVP